MTTTDRTIVLRTGNTLFGFDRATLEERWQQRIAPDFELMATESSVVVLTALPERTRYPVVDQIRVLSPESDACLATLDLTTHRALLASRLLAAGQLVFLSYVRRPPLIVVSQRSV